MFYCVLYLPNSYYMRSVADKLELELDLQKQDY